MLMFEVIKICNYFTYYTHELKDYKNTIRQI